MKKISLTIALVLFSSVIVSSQSHTSQQVRRDSTSTADSVQGLIDNYLENLLEQETQDAESSELLETLQHLQEDPLNLNDATIADLQSIPGITPIMARNIVVARERAGGFSTINDLLAIAGVDGRLLSIIKRFAQVSPPTPTQLSMNYRSRVGRDLEERRGFQDGSYLGSPWKSYNRAIGRYQYGTEGTFVDFGILTEKDAGETKLNDFTSGFVSLKTNSPLKQLILGDYSVEAGQGLTVWPSVGYSKGLEVIQPAKKSRRGIAPHISSNENDFYRGAAAVLALSPLEATAFYSNKKVDATLDSLGRVTSLYETGYHRTESELRRQFATSEKSIGARLQCSLGNAFTLGSTYITTRFENPVIGDRLYDFAGNESHVVGLDFDLYLDRLNVFGEWARSHTGAIAGVTGAFVGLARGVDFIICVRNYPRDFIGLHAHGFGERNGPPQDEIGVYTGLRLRLDRGILLSGYYDQFKFPWQTASVPFPIDGTDFLLRAELSPFERFDVELKYKSEVKGDAISAEDEFGRSLLHLADRRQQNGRITAALAVSRKIRFQGRVEFVKVDYSDFGKGGEGILLYQDLRWEPTPQLSVNARLTFFDTDSYDARVYEFESELRGAVSNPGLCGKGRRWYVTTVYNLFGGVDLSAKYSETYRDDLKVIGSGADQIDGNVESRFTAQVDVRL
jgi:hypothetical protein